MQGGAEHPAERPPEAVLCIMWRDGIKQKQPGVSELSLWLAYQDSNLDKQNQNLLCCHYTISQYLCAGYFPKALQR